MNKIAETGNKGLSAGNVLGSSESLSSQAYQTALNRTRQIIGEGLGQSIIPYGRRKWNCTPITANDYNAVINQNQQLQNNSKTLTDQIQQLNKFSDCPQV